MQYLDRYSRAQGRRHEVRPGITGWAQVNGRNLLDWDERFRMDVWYVDHCSLLVDLKIVFKTLACLVTRRGISAQDHATMSEFMGSDSVGKPAVTGRATRCVPPLAAGEGCVSGESGCAAGGDEEMPAPSGQASEPG
jgi:hypothetical protein